MITVYTDGGAINNPGRGGLGVVLKMGKHRKEISKGFRKTTNNRMELMAVIEALKALKKEKMEVTIHSDSQYVVNAIEKKWVFGWEKINFKKKKNPDLWKEFLKYYRKHNVKMVWVKGHAGIIENEICDNLVKKAFDNPKYVDTYYEELEKNTSNPDLYE